MCHEFYDLSWGPVYFLRNSFVAKIMKTPENTMPLQLVHVIATAIVGVRENPDALRRSRP